MIMRKRAFAGLRLRNRNTVAFGERGERAESFRIVHTASNDYYWPPRSCDQPRRCGKLPRVRAYAPLRPNTLGKEIFRIIVGLRLRILAERERDRSTRGGICQHVHGARHCRDDLLRARNAVEIARYRPETIVRRNGAIGKILHLLQDRVGPAVW